MNPFKPTAGMTPPILIGRSDALLEFREGMQNGVGSPGRLMRVSGARGMGKTVLLNEFGRMARNEGWLVVDETAQRGFCERIISRLQGKGHVTNASIAPNILGFEAGSVTVEIDALTLRNAIKKRASLLSPSQGILITLDEVQGASLDEMEQLAAAIQHMVREEVNVAFVFSGLPSMIGSIINGKTLTFLRRALPVDLGLVSQLEVEISYKDELRESEFSYSDDAAKRMASATKGHPFMVQLVGYYCWQRAERTNLALDDTAIDEGIALAQDRYNSMVIEPVLQGLSSQKLRFMLAMAQDELISKTADVARRMGLSLSSLSRVRDSLIKEGVIEAPAVGAVAFAVPYLRDYLREHKHELEAY